MMLSSARNGHILDCGGRYNHRDFEGPRNVVGVPTFGNLCETKNFKGARQLGML